MAFVPAPFQDADIDRVIEIVKPLRLQDPQPGPMVMNGPAGLVPMHLLPLVDFGYVTSVKSIYETHANVPGIDVNASYVLCRQGQFDRLHPTLRPRLIPNIPQIKMQLCVCPQPGGLVNIVKHFFWDDRMPVATAMQLIHHDAKTLKVLNANPKVNAKAFQWLFEQMGGLRVLWKIILPTEQEAAEMQAIDAGLDLIEEKAKTLNGGMAQLRWIMKEQRNPRSPIFEWKQSDIERAFRTVAEQGSLAKVRVELPTTLSSFDRMFVRHAVVPIIKTFSKHGLCMLGEPNQGKTPVALTLAFMFARFMIRKYDLDMDATVRSAPDLDFFRGQPGSLGQPFVLDDSDLNEQGVKKLKAFFDVGEEEAMTYQRWGASKFVRGQLRIACDNKYDEDADPPGDMAPFVETEHVTMNTIYNLIQPAFPKFQRPDVDAILKRASFIINSKRFVYGDQQPYRFRNVNEYGFLTREGGEAWQNFRDASVMPTSQDMRHAIDQEQRFLDRLFGSAGRRRWAAGIVRPGLAIVG